MDGAPLMAGLVDRDVVAEQLEVSPRTVYRLEETEGLPVIRFGHTRKYDLNAVRAWLLSRQQGGVHAGQSAHIAQ